MKHAQACNQCAPIVYAKPGCRGGTLLCVTLTPPMQPLSLRGRLPPPVASSRVAGWAATHQPECVPQCFAASGGGYERHALHDA
eukprot:362032-Chlamydomonas_euryale.AAC.7